jgi:hypothetical protein
MTQNTTYMGFLTDAKETSMSRFITSGFRLEVELVFESDSAYLRSSSSPSNSE